MVATIPLKDAPSTGDNDLPVACSGASATVALDVAVAIGAPSWPMVTVIV